MKLIVYLLSINNNPTNKLKAPFPIPVIIKKKFFFTHFIINEEAIINKPKKHKKIFKKNIEGFVKKSAKLNIFTILNPPRIDKVKPAIKFNTLAAFNKL
jgi:hypothetical protein